MNETPTRGPGSDCGLVVGGKYRLEILLGEGGFAAVYRARHTQIASLRVAVKILRAEHATNADIVARFHQEAHTAAALRNPHTVRIMDVGQTDDARPYMVMEYIDGASLDRVLARCRTLRPISVARLAAGILRALDEAHALGIIHRDMKPGNIMVVKERGAAHPIARVLDFGIAKVMGDAVFGLSASRATMGDNVFCTPQYAAPEVLRGEPCFQSDLYALGHMMAEMLGGRTPYWKGSPFEIAARQLDRQAVPLSDEVRATALGPVLERALQKNVADRYGTAAEMLEAIEEIYAILASGRPARRPTTRPSAASAPPPVGDEEPAADEPPQSPRTIGALARALALEAGEEPPAAEALPPVSAQTLPIGAPAAVVPRAPRVPAAAAEVSAARPAEVRRNVTTPPMAIAAVRPTSPRPGQPPPGEVAAPSSLGGVVAPPSPAAPADVALIEIAEVIELRNPIAAGHGAGPASPPSAPARPDAAPAAQPPRAATAQRPRPIPQQRLTAPGMEAAPGARTVSMRMDVGTDEFASIAPERALRRSRAAGGVLATVLVLATGLALLLLWMRTTGGDPVPTGAEAAVPAASAALQAAARPAAETLYTFSANVEGGTAWYRGEKVGDLPLFGVYSPDPRPLIVEFRHPLFGAQTVELGGESGEVLYRASFRGR